MAKQTAAKQAATKQSVPQKNGRRKKASDLGEAREFPRWTFLTNHAHVLVLLHADPDLVLRQVALEVGITERAVQKIIHDLEEEGFIEIERIGRQNHYRVVKSRRLRHPIESHRKIGDLLSSVADDGKKS